MDRFFCSIFNEYQLCIFGVCGMLVSTRCPIAFLLPVLIWNYQNDWISFAFQGARAGSGREFTLHFDWFFTSIAGQAMWLLPWIWGPLVWQVPRLCKTTQAAAFCFWTALWPIVFFTSVALWSNPQGHF